MTLNKILLVYKKSIFELYSQSDDPQTRQYAQLSSQNNLRQSHDRQQHSIQLAIDSVNRLEISHDIIYRALLADTELSQYDLLVSLGGDGTLMDISHYVGETPILGVSTDPQKSVGFYNAAHASEICDFFEGYDSVPKTSVPRIQVTVDGIQIPELIINEAFFTHSNPAAMSRFFVTNQHHSQEFRSSGLLACCAGGSTAFMYQAGGNVMPFSDSRIQYIPCINRNAQSQYATSLEIESATRKGMLYLDGEHVHYEFTLGQKAVLKQGTPLTILGDLQEKQNKY